MEENENYFQDLFEKADRYAKTNVDLFKLKSINKSADVVSSLLAKAVYLVVFLFGIMFVSIGLSLWIGELLGNVYYGFFVMAILFLVVAAILRLFRNKIIKEPMNNSMIMQLMKDDSS